MFKSAVTKLTLWYLLIIMVISLFFSWALFSVTNNELERSVFRARPGIVFFDTLPDSYQQQLQTELTNLQGREILSLVRFNLIVLILAGGASYLLARRTLKPIEAAMEAQSRFTGDASHELRTPLTAMRSEIEVALREAKLSPSEARTLLQSNLEEVIKLEALSQGLLQLARFSSQQGEIETTELDLAEPVKAAAERLEKLATAKGIKLDVKLKHIMLHANEASISELFVTLIDNAIKYGKTDGHIEVSMKSSGKDAVVVVRDNGIGIKADELPFIFDRFYRADSSRSKGKADGYGLGLSLAAQIAAIHHGSISAESTEGQGSTFTVKLPTTSHYQIHAASSTFLGKLKRLFEQK